MKFPFNFSLSKLLDNKRFAIALSIVLAFVLWLSLIVNQKPTMERTISDITVNVNLENTFAAENNMSIIGDISEQKFTVVVRGPSYAVGSLTASDLSLFASAATVDSPGEYSLDVASANANAAEYEILSISPRTLKINFDYMETKEFTVTALAEGAVAAEGLIAETGVVGGTESDTVTITGPRTVVNKIESVVATAKVNKTLSVSETFDADIVLYDTEGEVIKPDHLTLSASKVKVTVPISKKKTVPVKVEFSGLPQGFNADKLLASVDIPNVTVIGTPETIDKTTSVSLSAIPLNLISKDKNSFDVSPKLPEGVRLLDTIDHFTVTVNTDGYSEKTLMVSNFEYKGLSSGLKASGAASIKNVKICGPRSVINKVSASNVYAMVDLTDKKAGEHTVDVVICFKEFDNVWAIGTYKTTVNIK